MTTKQYDAYSDLITFTRASTGTYLDSDGLLKTATTNTPRIEYDANGNRKGLLIEEARTNTMIRSEEFDTWTQSSIITSSNVTNAPSGELTADKVAKSVTTTINAAVVRAATTPTGSLVVSFYAKAAEYDTLSFTLFNSTDGHLARASVSLVDGSLIFNQNGTVTTEFVGNGWWRIVGIGTTTQTTNALYIYPNDSSAYQGDGTSGIFLWGAQLEAGSFPTSYIPTAGSTATRAADVASIPTSAFGFNPDKGTVVVDFETKFGGTANSFPRICEIGNTSTAVNRAAIFVVASSGQINSSIRSNDVIAASLTLDTQTSPASGKVASAFADNDFSGVINGGSPVTDTSGSFTTPSIPRDRLKIGGAGETTLANMSGHIKSLSYFPRRLSNAQLVRLTS